MRLENAGVETTVVSLGGGCDVATILGDFGVRRASLPFDWLWNLDTGLETVCDIIVDDFAQILKPDSYGLTEHYRFPSRLSVTYGSYPSVVHMHSDPFRVPEDHATLVRRIQRFRRTLQDAPHITFVYYRCLEEGRIKRSDSTLRDEFVRLQTEGARFSEAISSTRRGGGSGRDWYWCSRQRGSTGESPRVLCGMRIAKDTGMGGAAKSHMRIRSRETTRARGISGFGGVNGSACSQTSAGRVEQDSWCVA